ncbi:MAG TPA: hypothetical protein PKN36_10390 [bacterium]|nr:hypothetical protein [bacterium]
MKKLIIILLILGLSGCFGSVSRHKAEKTYYLNGQLKVDNNPKDGGWRRTYFDNGQLETEYLYESYKPIPEDLFNWTIYGDTDVLYDGYFKSYHRNGKLAQEGPIKASRRVGLWKQ